MADLKKSLKLTVYLCSVDPTTALSKHIFINILAVWYRLWNSKVFKIYMYNDTDREVKCRLLLPSDRTCRYKTNIINIAVFVE